MCVQNTYMRSKNIGYFIHRGTHFQIGVHFLQYRIQFLDISKNALYLRGNTDSSEVLDVVLKFLKKLKDNSDNINKKKTPPR